MELLRSELIERPQDLTAKVRANRGKVLAGAASGPQAGAGTKAYLASEVAFGDSKGLAYLAFGMAEVFDLMEAGRWHAAEAQLALLLVAVEQAANQKWRWSLAWLMTHLPEPPWHAIARHPRPDAIRPLAKLAEPSWVAAAIAYLKDVQVVSEAAAPKRESAGGGGGAGGGGAKGSPGKAAGKGQPALEG